jgi:hypothetical protein
MRFNGGRRARGIILVLVAVLVFVLWRVTRLYAQYAYRSLGPTLLAQVEARLQRKISVERLLLDQPGKLIAEGVQVANGRTFESGTLLSATRIELTYDPALLGWKMLWSRGVGGNTRARFRATGLWISAPPPLASVLPSGKLLAVDEVASDLNLQPLLSGQGNVLPTIGHITARHPQFAALHRPDGKWELAEHLNGKDLGLRGVLDVQSAEIDLIDFDAGKLPGPQRNRINGSFQVQFAGTPLLRFAGKGRVLGENAATFDVSGVRDGAKSWYTNVRAQTGSMPYWYHYFVKEPKGVDVTAGAAQVAGSVWDLHPGPASKPLFRLDLDVQSGGAKIEGITKPFSDFRGRIVTQPDLLTLAGDARVGTTPVKLNGQVMIGPQGRADWTIDSRAVNLATLHELAPDTKLPRELAVSGPVHLTAALSGVNKVWDARGEVELPRTRFGEVQTPSGRLSFTGRFGQGIDPTLDGGFAFPKLTKGTYVVSEAGGRFTLRGSVIQATAKFRGFDGAGTARGWLDTSGDKPLFYATGSVRDIDLASLPVEDPALRMNGTGSADFVVSGTQDKPAVSGFVRAANLEVKGQQVAEASGRIHLEGEDLIIEQGRLRDSRGEVAVSGKVGPKKELALAVTAEGLDAAKLVPPAKNQPPLFGQVYLRGRLTGTPDAPRLDGRVQVYHPGYGDLRGDYAEGSVEAHGNFVQVSGLKLIRAPSSVEALGAVTVSRTGEMAPWQVDGAFQVRGLTVNGALRMLPETKKSFADVAAAGDIGMLTVQAKGDLAAPHLSFSGQIERAIARGIDLGRVTAEGSFDMQRRRLELARFEATPAEGSVTANGVLELPADNEKVWERTEVSLHVETTHLDLGRALARYAPELDQYGQVAARLTTQIEVSGTGADLSIQAPKTELKAVVLNGIPASVAPLNVSYRGGTTILRGLSVQARGGSLSTPVLAARAAAKGEKTSRWASAPIAVRGFPVALALDVLESSPALPESERGWLDTFDRWASRAGEISGDLGFGKGVVAGTPDAQIRQALEGAEAPLAPTGTLTVSGLQPAPGLGAPARLTADFTGSSNQLTLRTLKLDQPGGLQASASGTISALDSGNAGLALKIQVQGLDLNLSDELPDPAIQERFASLQPLRGMARFTGTLGGTQKQPAARFNLDVQDPVVAGIPLDRVSVQDAELTAATSRFKIGGAVLAKRPSPGAAEASIRFSGTLPLQWPELTIPGDAARDLTVEFPRQPLSVLNALASDAERAAAQFDLDQTEGRERFTHLFGHVLAPEGVIEGRVRLAGTANNPNNSGSLNISSDSVRIRGFAASAKKPGWQFPTWIASEISGSEPLETEVKNFRAAIDLTGDRLRLSDLRGQSSQGGAFRGSGEVLLGRGTNAGPAARLNLALSVDGLRISEKDGARVLGEPYRGTQLKGTLTSVSPASPTTLAPIRVTGDWPNVTVSGGLRVDEASLPLAFDSAAGGEHTPLPDNVNLNLALMSGKNVWLRNQVVRLELQPSSLVASKLQGALLVTNQLAAPVVQGTLLAQHGVFNLPLIRLRNAEGPIRVAYDGRNQDLEGGGPSPVYVDLTAETTLRIQRSPAVEADYYDATFEIRGSPGEGGIAGVRSTGAGSGLAIGAEGGLTVTVRTDPPLPSTQIEALIRQQYVAEGFGNSGANVVEALRGQIEQAFAVNVASEFTGRVEDAVRNALGLSIFSVDFGVSQPLRVRLGKRLFGPVFGTVSQSFGTPEDQVQRRYEVYYRVSPQFRFGYRQEDPINRKVLFFSGTASF